MHFKLIKVKNQWSVQDKLGWKISNQKIKKWKMSQGRGGGGGGGCFQKWAKKVSSRIIWMASNCFFYSFQKYN